MTNAYQRLDAPRDCKTSCGGRRRLRRVSAVLEPRRVQVLVDREQVGLLVLE